MNDFQIALTRTYIVSIKAATADDAKMYTEYYLGDCKDLSTFDEKRQNKFFIDDIEMVDNRAEEIIYK